MMRLYLFGSQYIYSFIFSLFCLMVNSNVAISSEINIKAVNETWMFDVFLDDDRIGYHAFDVYSNNDETTISSMAEFDVSILFINIYSYKHKNKETWVNNCLVKLSSNTDDNGDKQFVRVVRNNKTFDIETTTKTTSSQGCLRSFAYWDKNLINYNALINSQTGEIVSVEFISLGSDALEVNGKQILAEKYLLTGVDESNNIIEIDLWYSSDNKWLALRSKLEDGNYLRYQLVRSGYK